MTLPELLFTRIMDMLLPYSSCVNVSSHFIMMINIVLFILLSKSYCFAMNFGLIAYCVFKLNNPPLIRSRFPNTFNRGHNLHYLKLRLFLFFSRQLDLNLLFYGFLHNLCFFPLNPFTNAELFLFFNCFGY